MYRILRKEVLSPSAKLMEIEAPYVARKAEPGQFIILRIDEAGERIPLTVADFSRDKGTVTIIFQEVGKTTKALGRLNAGDALLDFVGPLGVPSHFDGVKSAAVIGGGLGTAIAYPQAKKLHSMGAQTDCILGFRNQSLVFLEKEMGAVSSRLFVTTDDGSYGEKGFVTGVLQKLLGDGCRYDVVIAIGPLIMMKAVSNLTRPYGIRTIVSMNPVMVDGTGMCGGCRVTVDGKTQFACVDGPDFDGHVVDFDEAMRRQLMYKKHEQLSDAKHACKLTGDETHG